MGDTVTRLIDGVRSLEADALSLGLKLNHAKCEILGLSKEGQNIWQSSGLNFALIESESAYFLGSPLGTEGVDEALKAKSQELNEISQLSSAPTRLFTCLRPASVCRGFCI